MENIYRKSALNASAIPLLVLVNSTKKAEQQMHTRNR